MILTVRPVKTIIQNSKCILDDIMIPLSKRNGFSLGKISVIPVYFCRYIGIKENENTYYEELTNLDKNLIELDSSYLKFTKPIPFLFYDRILNAAGIIWEQITENLIKSQDNTHFLYNAGIFPHIKCNTLMLLCKHSLRY